MTNPFNLGMPGDSLSAFSPSAKLLCLLLSVLSLVQARGSALVLLVLFAIGLQFRKGAGLLPTLSGLGPVLILCIFSVAAAGLFPRDGRLFAAETLALSLPNSARLLASFFFAKAFYASTRLRDLGDSFSSAARVLAAPFGGRSRPSTIASDPGMFFSLGLVFLPRSFDAYIRVKEAAAARGYSRRLSSGLRILETALYASVRKALRTAEAMEARAYSPSRTLRLRRWKPRDFALFLFCSAVFAAVLVLR